MRSGSKNVVLTKCTKTVVVQLLRHVQLCDSTDCTKPGFPFHQYLYDYPGVFSTHCVFSSPLS